MFVKLTPLEMLRAIKVDEIIYYRIYNLNWSHSSLLQYSKVSLFSKSKLEKTKRVLSENLQ
jgi:hypothetical protein